MKKNLLLGKKNDKVGTPDWVYDSLNAEFRFDHDPCPLDWDESKPDGLTTEWGSRNFVNPPFSQIKKWVLKSLKEVEKGKLVVMLLTARINNNYWWDHIWPNAAEIRFISGNLQFKGYEKVLPIPMAIVIFRPNSVPLLWGQLSKGKLSGREFIRVLPPLPGKEDSSQCSQPMDEM
jgi:hypothetical protein